MKFCVEDGRLLPGFRFHPMDVELVMYYLKRKVLGKRLEPEVIAEVDIYLFHPKDLQELACLKKDLNWYFFCARGKKYGSGNRTNRATEAGYWKATGNDRAVSYEGRTVGKIKTLIFHHGKPPKGERTDWVMHEYRLEDKNLDDEGVCQDSYVLCKIFMKSGWGPKNGEQYGAPFIEEDWDEDDEIPNCAEVVQVDVQNQSTSVVTHSAFTNVLVSVNACPISTSAQVDSGAVSASSVEQAPTSISNSAAVNARPSSMVLAPNYDDAADQVIASMSMAANWASCSKGLFPSHYDPVVQATADIASTSTAPVPDYDDDEIDRMLEYFKPDDFRDIFQTLEGLDPTAVPGTSKFLHAEGGLDLDDLDAAL